MVGEARTLRADEFFGEEHGRVAKVGGVVVNESAEGKFRVSGVRG